MAVISAQNNHSAVQVLNIEPNGFMETAVQWLTSDETPTLYKIGALALPLILSYAIGTLIGYPLLSSAIIVLPTSLYALVAWISLNARRNEVQECAQSIASELNNIRTAVGGVEAFNALPVLDIGDRIGDTGYLDFIQPEHMPHSVMRGTDSVGRPFISLKIRSNSPREPDGQDPFVITFFQRFINKADWTFCRYSGYDPIGPAGERIFGDFVRDEDRAIIRQIVVDRNHPILTLV